ncbi:hypothetical protein SPONN_441 [uncultured Candidatus Thioglobus sp.]|nr:hypothetical protein SPONN_441 [uncultured Candidatus Thioglobus sp.]
MDRRICTGCKEELSRGAFYRHLTPSVCPGRHSKTHDSAAFHAIPAADGMDSELHMSEDLFEDSYYEPDGYNSDTMDDESQPMEIEIVPAESGTVLEEMEGTNSSTDSEIQTTNGTESGAACSKKTTPILRVVSYMMFFFQLKFKIADRAINCLHFVKSVLCMIALLIPSNKDLSDVINKFPLTLYSAKNTIAQSFNDVVTKYVMCTIIPI